MSVPLAWSELRRYRVPVQRVALLFLILLPSLYGGLYLWSNWNPYGSLEDIKVAVVDEDQPVEVQGQQVDGGERVVRRLEAEPIVAWTRTDADDARTGLADGTYLMTITIPQDFSANLAAAQSGDPKAAEVVLRRNGANGFIVGVAAQGLAIELKERINAAATSAYFAVAFEQLAQLRTGLQQAADGSTRLRDGLATAQDGAGQLSSGLVNAHDASVALHDGAEQVAQGDARIAGVVDPLVDRVVPALPAAGRAADQVAGSAARLSGLVAQDATGLPTRTAQVVSALDAWAQSHPDQAADPAFQQIQQTARAAASRAGDVVAATQDVRAAADAVNARVDAATAEIPVVQQRIEAARSDIDRLASGSRQVADGLGELTTGLQTAADGAGQLVSGTQELHQGASTLADGLTSAVAQVPTLGQSDPQGTAEQLADPTEVRVESENEAKYYGQGLAPFFFGIALCVFGVAVFTILRPVNPRGLASRSSSLRVALAGFLPVAAIGWAGALVLLAIVQLGLGLDPRSWPATIALVLVASFTFTAIAHALRTAFGIVGSAVALVLLMVQLTSAAGIYPEQTLPLPFRVVHPLLPMSHVVDGLRISLTGGPQDRYVRDLVVVGAIGLLGLAAGVAATAWRRRWRITQLKPVLGE